MNFRKSLRSTHINQASSKSLRKIQLNEQDLNQCNQYNQSAQSTKQSQNSILNKLLLQPPSMKSSNNNIKKLSINNQSRKYQQKFQKPDVQNLIQQNINLKNVIQGSSQTVSGLKIKNVELQRKIKLLQKGLYKFQQDAFRVKQNNIKQDQQQSTLLQRQSLSKQPKASQQNKKQQALSLGYSKTGIVHTQILKKKIADLTAQNISTQNELRFLKKLPPSTIYEQNDVQKQHLIAETIRLKSIITSLSQEMHHTAEKEMQPQNQKFQNQFMRLMKQQNQKLKSTIRILQNEKTLLKSRQTIMNKLNTDLKKQIQHLKTKLLYKQSELQKLNNQNKNLLFKKTTQFRQEQEKKQNETILQLKAKLLDLQTQKTKIGELNDFYTQQNVTLKQKQKHISAQMLQIQGKYEKIIKNLNQQIQQAQFQLSNVKSDYMNIMNASSMKKKKSIGFCLHRQPSLGNSGNNRIPDRQSTSANQSHDKTTALNQNFTFSLHRSSSYSKQVYYRPVKWQDISLAMAILFKTLEANSFLTVDGLIRSIQQQNQVVRCVDFISIFMEEPFHIGNKQAVKLARYITQDSSVGPNTKVLFNQNLTISSSLAKTILQSFLQKMQQKCSVQFQKRWYLILQKTKKLLPTLKSQLQQTQIISKHQIIQLMQKYSRKKIQLQQYEYLFIKCFDRRKSQEEFIINVNVLIGFLQNVQEIKISMEMQV